MRQDALNSVLQEIASQREQLISEIAQHNSAYWDWFQAENEQVLKLRASGLTDKRPAHIAPVLEKRVSGKKKSNDSQADGQVETSYTPKYYLIWKLFNNSGYRKANKHASVHIPVANPDKIVSVIGKKCTWEFEKFCEVEAKLAPLRVELDGLHDAEIKLRAAQRKYARKFNQHKER